MGPPKIEREFTAGLVSSGTRARMGWGLLGETGVALERVGTVAKRVSERLGYICFFALSGWFDGGRDAIIEI